MPIANADIARQLDEVADLLDIGGGNALRVRAYRRAARAVEGLPRSVTDMLRAGEDLDTLPGIGRDLAAKIAILAGGGRLEMKDSPEPEVPPGTAALLALPGLGPKRVNALYERHGIDSLDALSVALRDGRLQGMPGFGPGILSALRRILTGAERLGPPRILLSAAEQIVTPLLAALRGARGVSRVEAAGSFRRRRETVGGLDIVAAADPSTPVMDRFVQYDDVTRVVERGTTRATVTLHGEMQVDLRVVPPDSFGAALCYFTGSQAHNIALRQIAVERHDKLNEYGLFRGTRRLAGRTEAEMYQRLGMTWVPPELREGGDEIIASQRGQLPHLVGLEDIRGDLHLHTTASDGRDDLTAMVREARSRGYDYIAVTDHSHRQGETGSLDSRRLSQQIDEIGRLNATLDGFAVLAGMEVDILEDGSLELPYSILHRLDIVVASVHSHYNLSAEKQTDRLLRAMDHRAVQVLAHPTGRLIDHRAPYPLDLERLLRGAAERGVWLELNAQPERLDLTDMSARMAKQLGVKLAISSDAHAVGEMALMRLGVGQARRGWLEASDVVNTRKLADLRLLMRRD